MSDELLEIDGEEFSLSDIAGIAMDEVEEVRSSQTPAGLFQFKVKEAKLDTMDTQKGKKAFAGFVLTITDVKTLVDEKLDVAKVVDKEHSERFFITDPVEDLGRIKAFMQDTGFQGSGTLQELLDQFVDTEFLAVVSHRKDKNDADKIYANINRNKVAPLGTE